MPCVACTYMPNASWRRRGGKAQGEGYLPSGAKRRTSEAKVCTSAARKTAGKPLAPRQGSALSEVWFPNACASSAQELSGSRCGRNRPQRWEAENAQRSQRGRRLLPVEGELGVGRGISSRRTRLPIDGQCRMMEEDGYAPSWVSKPKQKHCALVRHGPNSQRLSVGEP